MVTHNPAHLKYACRVFEMRDGRLSEKDMTGGDGDREGGRP